MKYLHLMAMIFCGINAIVFPLSVRHAGYVIFAIANAMLLGVAGVKS